MLRARKPLAPGTFRTPESRIESIMHYPRRNSKIKRVRKFGFRARMKTKSGRKMINRRRRAGRALPAA